jgi:hypothetical protein
MDEMVESGVMEQVMRVGKMVAQVVTPVPAARAMPMAAAAARTDTPAAGCTHTPQFAFFTGRGDPDTGPSRVFGVGQVGVLGQRDAVHAARCAQVRPPPR